MKKKMIKLFCCGIVGLSIIIFGSKYMSDAKVDKQFNLAIEEMENENELKAVEILSSIENSDEVNARFKEYINSLCGDLYYSKARHYVNKLKTWDILQDDDITVLEQMILERENEYDEARKDIEKYTNGNRKNEHSCMECSKNGTLSIIGISGETEYYCTEHYNKLIEIMNKLYGDE